MNVGDKSINASEKDFIPFTSEETEVKKAKGTTPAGIQSYEGVDSYSEAIDFFTALPFYDTAVYEALSQFPQLDVPNPDAQSGPAPYSQIEQKIIIKSLVKEMKKMLEGKASAQGIDEIINAVITGKTLTDPKLAALAKTYGKAAIDKTRKEGNLPESWVPTSTSPHDWTALPVQPYGEEKIKDIEKFYNDAVQHFLEKYISSAEPPLTPDQIALLKKAIATDQVPSEIAEAYISVTKSATLATQENFGLANSWVKGTTDVESLKPVNVGIVNPTSKANAVNETIVENLEKIHNEISNAVDKAFGNIPGKAKNAMKDYLGAIANAILFLKDQLMRNQIADSESSTKAENTKFDQLETRRLRGEEMQKKIQEVQKKQEKQKKISKWFKWLGPIISAVTLIISVIVAVVTFPVGTAVALAGIAVAAAMLTYSVVDMKMGITMKIVKAVDNLIKNMLPDSSPMVRTLVKISAVVVAVIIVAVIIAAAALTGSLAGMVTNAAAQAVTKFVSEAFKQLGINVLMMTVMCSNVIPDLMAELCKKWGLDQKGTMIAQIITSVVATITIMIAISMTKGAASKLIKSPDQVLKDLQKVADDIYKSIKQLPDTLKNLPTATLNALKQLPGNIWHTLKNVAFQFKDLIIPEGGFVSLLKGGDPLKKYGLHLLYTADATAKSTRVLGDVVGGVINGVLLVQVSKLLRIVGDSKSEIEFLQEMIKLMEKVLHLLQSSMSGAAEAAEEAGKMITEFFNAAGQSRGKLAQTIQG